jgi:Right handed beta helix region
VSYTLRGRIESRLAALLLPLLAAIVVAAALQRWWPIELLAAMTVAAVALDLLVYHGLLPYQPGWAALALGALELAVLMGLVRALRIDAPLAGALALFAAGWVGGQLLGHAILPLARPSYAEDGGELGRAGPLLAVGVAGLLAAAGGIAWATQPPTVHLSAGLHKGPIVITRSEKLVGEPGAIVRGGIIVRHDDVTVRNVTVIGGENGIVVDDAERVILDRVRVSGAKLDGIHVRLSSVTIRNCEIDSLGNPWAQGIDISFAIHLSHSHVEGCTIVGGQDGIVTHSVNADLVRNHVSRTRLTAIGLTEMSMGMIAENEVRDARGIGIVCGDHSMCMIERNVVIGTRRDDADGNTWRSGFGVLASWYSEAELADNQLAANPRPFGAVANSLLTYESD